MLCVIYRHALHAGSLGQLYFVHIMGNSTSTKDKYTLFQQNRVKNEKVIIIMLLAQNIYILLKDLAIKGEQQNLSLHVSFGFHYETFQMCTQCFIYLRESCIKFANDAK